MKLKNKIVFTFLLAAGIVFVGIYFFNGPTAQEKTNTQLLATSLNSNTTNPQTQPSEKNKKILIAYFSHTGNTKDFAERIQKEVGGDLFAIEPQDAYPKNYDDVVKQAKGEVESKHKPLIKNKITDIRSYDIVFIGTPIWWYTVAPPVRTFLSEYDLSDKTIIPFSTHKGSGLSGIDKTIKELQPKAKVLEGFAIWNNQAEDKQADIANWLQKLNL